MSCGNLSKGIASTGQAMVSQEPVFDNAMKRKKKKNENQVISKSGIIRPDKRKSAHYL
jgi:hypothetical protein